MSDHKNKRDSMSVQVAMNAHQIQTEWHKHSRPTPVGKVPYYDIKCPVCKVHGLPEFDDKGVKVHHGGRIAVCRMAEADAKAFSPGNGWIGFDNAVQAASGPFRRR